MRKLWVLAVLVLASQAWGESVAVPVDLGIGPAAFVFAPGPVFDDQPVHYGVKISLQAIIDQQLLKKEQNRIPARYRKLVLRQKEIRITPFPLTLIPEELFISPKLDHTGIFGATFKPIALGLAVGGSGLRFGLDGGLVLTAAYLYGDTLPDTFFARPGVSLQAELEWMPTKVFGLSVGWESAAYIPQVIGGSFTDVTPTEQAIWHIGNAFLKLHFRFPYRTNL